MAQCFNCSNTHPLYIKVQSWWKLYSFYTSWWIGSSGQQVAIFLSDVYLLLAVQTSIVLFYKYLSESLYSFQKMKSKWSQWCELLAKVICNGSGTWSLPLLQRNCIAHDWKVCGVFRWLCTQFIFFFKC